jgi:multisubunit Na+/H+ antiporter MnhF subunit
MAEPNIVAIIASAFLFTLYIRFFFSPELQDRYLTPARVRVLAGLLLALLVIIVLVVSGGDLPFSAIAHARKF